jgi:hypothetical protein
MLAEAKANTLKLKSELQRMEQRLADVEGPQGGCSRPRSSRPAAPPRAPSPPGAAAAPSTSCGAWRPSSTRTEAEVAASREIADALGPGTHSGLSRDELETKFASLERGTGARKGGRRHR